MLGNMFLLIAALTGAAVSAIPTQCPNPTSRGCAKPTWPVHWSMRQSLYAYCFEHCPLEFFANNTHLGVFGGVIGVDHYCERPPQKETPSSAPTNTRP